MSFPKLTFEVWPGFPFHFGTFSDQRLFPAELPKSDLHPSPVHSAMNMARRSPLRCGQPCSRDGFSGPESSNPPAPASQAKGLANSLARPGGSATGVAMMAAELDGKRASLLHEFVPAARRIAILTGRPPRHAEGAAEAQRVAGELGLETDVFYADEPTDYAAAFAGMRTARSEALVIISAPDFFRDAALLSRLALEASLPTVCEWASMARDGCLIGYGPNFAALWRRPAEYVARILRGDKPGELPIEQPTLFEFAVNLKTAKALGLTVPESALQRADEVFE